MYIPADDDDDELTVTVLGIICCLYPLDVDEAAVTTVGKGGATLFRMTLTVDLEDDDILVQVIKEPFSGKGPRVTTQVSIPGSLMVLVPSENYIGISRKISDKYEKRRLRRTVKDLKPENFGLIVRTIAQGKDVSILESDFQRVWNKWQELDRK